MIFLVAFLLLNAVAHNAFSDGRYQITYEYGYNAGYEAGKQEQEEGYGYEPEVVLAQPVFQLLLKKCKASIGNWVEFDQAFKDGWFDGFKDGYYGSSKKRTRFS